METIKKSPLEDKVLEMIEETLKDTPYRVVDLDCRMGGKSLLRLFIERRETKAASIGDCATVSRLLDPALEASSLFTGPFELEVSSPGIDRRLRLQTDFQENIGREVKLEFTEKLEGIGGAARGELLKAENGNVVLKSSGKEILVRLNQIQRAQSIYKDETRGK